MLQPVSRVLAALVALLAIIGDALLLRGQMAHEHVGLIRGLITDSMFFTDLSNLLVAVVFCFLALDLQQRRRSWMLGTTLLCILLTALGAQGWRLLPRPVTGSSLAHAWVPLAVALWCLAFTVKGRLRWRFLGTWTLVPLSYLIYMLVRGSSTGRYAYPWLNPAQVGWQKVVLNAMIQLAAFVLLAVLLVALDHLWARGSRRIAGSHHR